MQRLNICAKIIDVFLMFEADMMEGFRCEQSLLSSILNQSGIKTLLCNVYIFVPGNLHVVSFLYVLNNLMM